MHLHEFMGWPGPLTDRQFRAWLALEDRDRDIPDRHDWYLMQTMAELWMSSYPKLRVRAEQFLMEFKKVEKRTHSNSESDIALATAMSKDAWGVRTGGDQGQQKLIRNTISKAESDALSKLSGAEAARRRRILAEERQRGNRS